MIIDGLPVAQHQPPPQPVGDPLPFRPVPLEPAASLKNKNVKTINTLMTEYVEDSYKKQKDCYQLALILLLVTVISVVACFITSAFAPPILFLIPLIVFGTSFLGTAISLAESNFAYDFANFAKDLTQDPLYNQIKDLEVDSTLETETLLYEISKLFYGKNSQTKFDEQKKEFIKKIGNKGDT